MSATSAKDVEAAKHMHYVYNQIFLTLPLYVQDFVDTSDIVYFVNALSPDFAHYLAPVDPCVPSVVVVESLLHARPRVQTREGTNTRRRRTSRIVSHLQITS